MLSAEALLSARWRTGTGHSPTAAIGAGFIGREGDDISLGGDPSPGYRAEFPRSRLRYAMLGWEYLRVNGAAVRVMAGPGWDATPRTTVGRRVGWQARSDVSAVMVGPLGVVASLRWGQNTYGPRGLHVVGAGLGLRLR
jgi:hypothetical protein